MVCDAKKRLQRQRRREPHQTRYRPPSLARKPSKKKADEWRDRVVETLLSRKKNNFINPPIWALNEGATDEQARLNQQSFYRDRFVEG